MQSVFRNIRLISWTLWLEAWRRREIYAIVIVTTVLIVGLRFVHFFNLEGLGKFYREIGLKIMNVTTAAAVILLAARQLPREFTNRTIYTLLAKPVGRLEFLLGKYCGVLGAGVFCYALFMAVFVAGSVTLKSPIEPVLFLQAIYLQILALAVLAAMVFLLSMLLSPDAAVTLGAILYLASQVLMNMMSILYEDLANRFSRALLLGLHYVIPQLTLFDASAKVVHSTFEGTVVWPPLAWGAMWQLTAYALVYVAIFLVGAHLLFRRRPL